MEGQPEEHGLFLASLLKVFRGGVGNCRWRLLGETLHRDIAGADLPSSSSSSPWHLPFAPDASAGLRCRCERWCRDELGRRRDACGDSVGVLLPFSWGRRAIKGSQAFRGLYPCKTQGQHHGCAEGISPAPGHRPCHVLKAHAEQRRL